MQTPSQLVRLAFVCIVALFLLVLATSARAQAIVLGKPPTEDTLFTTMRAKLVVPVRMEFLTSTNVAAARVRMTYTASRFTLDSVRSAFAGWTVVANTDTAGVVTWAAFAPIGIRSTTALVRLHLTVKPVTGTTRIAITSAALTTELAAAVPASAISFRRVAVRVQ